MQPETPDDAQVLVGRGGLTFDQYRALGERDRHNLAYLLRVSDHYANGERILAAEMRPLARVVYTRASLVKAYVLIVAFAMLPFAIGIVLGPWLTLVSAVVLLGVCGVAWWAGHA